MSDSHQKPDLEEAINVTETHGRVARQIAAAARENKLGETGNQPIAPWLILLLVAVGIAAGAVFKGGQLFAYDETFQEGYIRAADPDEAGSVPPVNIVIGYGKKGGSIYASKCAGCHGADGKGDGANYPALSGSAWVTGPTERLSMVIINGLHGPSSTGKTFGGAGGMPPQGGGLAAQDLATVMTYIRNNLGNSTGDVVTAEMAKAAYEISGKRPKAGTQVDSAELDTHKQDLPGDKPDVNLMVDPATLAPVEAK